MTSDTNDRGQATKARQGSAMAMGAVVAAIVLFGVFALRSCSCGARRGIGEDWRQRAEREKCRQAPAALDRFRSSRCGPRTGARHAADLMGKWTVLSFGFTHCTLLCPIMDGQLYRLQGMMDDLDNVQFLTVSVDPEHDTVERLGDYSKQMGVIRRCGRSRGRTKRPSSRS